MLFHDYLGTTDLKDKDKSKVAFLSHHVKTMSVLSPTAEIPFSPYPWSSGGSHFEQLKFKE